jgi:multidrug efflux pump subunit AcrA (membrane-fusion protein)
MDVAQKLFREEVVSRRFGRLQGDVLIVVPRSWLAVSFVLFVVVACGLLVAFSVRYSRYTSVAGMVQPDRGVANLLAVRAGMISGVQVRIGDQVKAGQALIMVRSYEDLIAGGSAGDRSREVLPVQSTNIATDPSAAFEENCAQVNGVIAEMAGLQSRVDGLVGQTEMQNSLVKLGESQINDAQVLLPKGS